MIMCDKAMTERIEALWDAMERLSLKILQEGEHRRDCVDVLKRDIYAIENRIANVASDVAQIERNARY